MKKRNRHVPPPPPVITPAIPSLPALRPRRLDFPVLGARSNQKRAFLLSAAPRNRQEPTARIDQNPVRPRLPEPPDLLVTKRHAHPLSADEFLEQARLTDDGCPLCDDHDFLTSTQQRSCE
jgi:hypothetical protein